MTPLFLALAFALATLTPAVAADITARDADVTISGKIEPGDDEKFTDAVTTPIKTVYLTSSGRRPRCLTEDRQAGQALGARDCRWVLRAVCVWLRHNLVRRHYAAHHDGWPHRTALSDAGPSDAQPQRARQRCDD